MSYCRFQNTANDLRDCAENIDSTQLSEDEFDARQKLIRACKDIVEQCYDDEGEPTGTWNDEYVKNDDEDEEQ